MIRNNELQKIAGDRMPIGIFKGTEEPFSTQSIRIEPGDRFYMFSDGYADQFGGKLGKKFMYKAFRKLLLDIHHLTMQQQHEKLGTMFDEWKGDLEQVDDVLVMGLSF